MAYISADFGGDSSCRFPFRVRTNQTKKQTDATERPTHAGCYRPTAVVGNKSEKVIRESGVTIIELELKLAFGPPIVDIPLRRHNMYGKLVTNMMLRVLQARVVDCRISLSVFFLLLSALCIAK